MDIIAVQMNVTFCPLTVYVKNCLRGFLVASINVFVPVPSSEDVYSCSWQGGLSCVNIDQCMLVESTEPEKKLRCAAIAFCLCKKLYL